MDRRKYIKAFTLGTIGTGVMLQACKTPAEQQSAPPALNYDRTPAEQAHYEKVMSEKFFDEHEMKTITVLGDYIIPRDEHSGSASDAGVPAFIEFIVKDMPHHQVPMRGGLKWLDIQCNKQFGRSFVDCAGDRQVNMLDQIAFPEQAAPGMEQGVAFFNLIRDLVSCGFFSSEIGMKDIGYMGNRPNQWDGVPEDVMKQYGLSLDPKLSDLYVKFDNA